MSVKSQNHGKQFEDVTSCPRPMSDVTAVVSVYIYPAQWPELGGHW